MNCIIIISNINDSIATVKLNHDITRNLPMDVVNIILLFTYKFKHQEKFQPVLRDIEDGSMIVLQTLGMHSFVHDSQPDHVMSYNFYRWINRMHPEYEDYKRYEGASRYLFPFDVIRSSKKLKKQHKRCKYRTVRELVALVERDYIQAGTEYDIDRITLDVSLSGKAQSFYDDFYRK